MLRLHAEQGIERDHLELALPLNILLSLIYYQYLRVNRSLSGSIEDKGE